MNSLKNKVKNTAKRTIEIIIGIILICIGILLALPMVPGPGTLFILGGILLISPYHGQKIIDWGKEKWHYIKSKYFNKHEKNKNN